jgi:peptidoglycan/LPS O-acetylase OafA/YrhL
MPGKQHISVGKPHSTYRPDIDGLRAVAVFAVIANHFNHQILPSGYLGVDIFFVISGYVITSSLLQRPGQSFAENLGNFYARRVKRIIPAMLMFIATMAVLICLFNPSPHESLQTGLAAIFGVSNLYLRERATDYFAPSTQLNVFTHTWSLGVEEQFYLVFPLISGSASTNADPASPSPGSRQEPCCSLRSSSSQRSQPATSSNSFQVTSTESALPLPSLPQSC